MGNKEGDDFIKTLEGLVIDAYRTGVKDGLDVAIKHANSVLDLPDSVALPVLLGVLGEMRRLTIARLQERKKNAAAKRSDTDGRRHVQCAADDAGRGAERLSSQGNDPNS